jgi:superfamily II DNA/RNA helicase
VAEGFAALGLSDAVVEAAHAAGYERPSPLQEAASNVLRRGSNVVLHGSSGAGVAAAFGMPLVDRLASGEATGSSPRGLVLAPTQQRAELLATGLSALAGSTGVAVRAIAPGWRAAGGDILVTTPQRALEGVETSELKLDAVQTLVVTEASGIFGVDGGAALETLVPLVPRDAQRVVTSAELTGDIERFIEAHVRKALTVGLCDQHQVFG